MTNRPWVNAVGLVYRDSRPKRRNKNKKLWEAWEEKVIDAVIQFETTLDSLDKKEFWSRAMMAYVPVMLHSPETPLWYHEGDTQGEVISTTAKIGIEEWEFRVVPTTLFFGKENSNDKRMDR